MARRESTSPLPLLSSSDLLSEMIPAQHFSLPPYQAKAWSGGFFIDYPNFYVYIQFHRIHCGVYGTYTFYDTSF